MSRLGKCPVVKELLITNYKKTNNERIKNEIEYVQRKNIIINISASMKRII